MDLARSAFRSLRRGALPLLWTLAALIAPGPSRAAIALADQPLFATVSVPGNLLLSLSVEYPTANTPAYFSTSAYSASSTYLGYFDGAKCYQYVYNTSTPASSYFKGYSHASSHACTSTSSVPLWSGNYLNWASMQSLDAFRWVLTGGNRSVDTTSQTILQKTYHSGQDGGSYAPNKSISTGVSGATPFNWSSVKTRIWGAGIKMWVTNTGTLTSAASSMTATDYSGQNSYTSTAASAATVYTLYMNVEVCSTAVGVESNCVLYGSNYKPEGLMQQYSSKLRFSAFGYLNDGNILRDGGVMRARMKYIGPTQPVPGSSATTNSAAEWSSSTGIMVANPDSSDASATTTAASAAGHAVSISQSGVMNYLNKFGYASSSYKTYDPVSELYYAGLRYLKNLGNVPEYSSLAGAGSTSTMTQWLDGFPVITDWSTDPIVYSCQANFVLGIGDVNTHRDANLYGSTIRSSNEPAMPSTVSADTSVNVKTATDMVGTLEGIGALGSTYVSSGRQDTYFMAGLAYDAHTKDIRSDLTGTQTVNTYWLDVLEGQTYVNNNVYYLATKYGGFAVPSGFSTYSGSNATGTLADGAWHTNTDTFGSNKRPDNYFTASNADVMKSGLTAAFGKISSETSAANSTAYSTISANVTSSGSVSYSATYDPSTWTGKVIASTVTYASDGTPTTTAQWDARALLSASTVTASTRKIVTCCTSTGAALPFTTTALAASTLSSRTYYASFAAVPGISSGSQSAANYLAYLRGDATNEVANGGVYRTRSYRLGDIVNAKPVAVAAPSASYYDYYNPGYSSFKSTYANRATVVYAGANDGMLHAFDGSVGASTSGSELFAYVPSFVYGSASTASTSGISTLGNPSFTHHYFVDATPGLFDVNLAKTVDATGSANDWRTLLIGGLGKGGNGYYAIDVTDPTSWTSETAVASKVLWEFTDSRMGYSYGTPSVVKTKKYGWVVVLTSGYNNSDGIGYFFFVNPRTGALLEAVATPSGSTGAPINMAHHTAFVPNYTDMTADAIYAGDLQGNVWRLDVTGTGAYAAPTLIATLKNASGNAQPVTTRPLVEVEPNSSARYVMIGTGRLLDDSDIASSDVQSFYAIVDGTGASAQFYTASTLPSGYSFPITRAQLNADTSLLSGIGSAPASAMGWYVDLPVSGGVAQRVNVDPTSNSGVVAFAGNLPNGSVCSPSGTGTLYAVSFATGKTVLQDSAGTLIPSSTPISGILTDLAIQRVNGTLRLYAGGSSGDVVVAPADLSTASGVKQLNWREVPLAD